MFRRRRIGHGMLSLSSPYCCPLRLGVSSVVGIVLSLLSPALKPAAPADASPLLRLWAGTADRGRAAARIPPAHWPSYRAISDHARQRVVRSARSGVTGPDHEQLGHPSAP